jgi:hypothetical protein
MNSDFEPPPKSWSILASVGGVVTAALAIAGLNFWSKHLSTTSAIQKPEISKSQTVSPAKEAQTDAIDEKSVVLQGTPITKSELTAAKIPYVAPYVGTLTPIETATARQAWLYF